MGRNITTGKHPAAGSPPPGLTETTFYRYHCHTEHTLEKLYADPHTLDWATQPDPFRRYDGTAVIVLPVPQRPAPKNYLSLGDSAPPPAPVTLQTVSNLLYYSMAVSAWKEVPGRNARWSLRVNPSSGNLHPTETHLIVRGVDGLPDGCYHFRVDEFALEARHQGKVDSILAALNEHCGLPPACLTVLLTSIFWREAWKYRDRAFRYCCLDLGHAVASVAEALTGLEYRPQYRHCFDDEHVARLLGLAETDERPGALLCGGPSITDLHAEAEETGIRFQGTPNRLSKTAVVYDSIEQVYSAGRSFSPADRPAPVPLLLQSNNRMPLAADYRSTVDFWHVVRTRRSAVAFDGQSSLRLDQLGPMLHRATDSVPGDVMDFRHARPGSCFVHLFLYVHRVTGLDPGIYYYDRPAHELVLFRVGDVQRLAGDLSLQQDIAADSAFAVSMIADFNIALQAFGERAYRAVHLEAGYIGQGLYLGAESVRLNATGIGAFFDTRVNRTLGMPTGMEVIYHFTVGRALPDRRIRQRKAYWFESDAAPGAAGPGAGVSGQ
jgi:SagB-type dehydrogenase family enzyme